MNRQTPICRTPFTIALLLLCMVTAATSGCAFRRWTTPLSATSLLTTTQHAVGRTAAQPTPRTAQILRRLDLAQTWHEDPQQAFSRLQQLAARDPHPQTVFAISELSYLYGVEAESSDPRQAIDLLAMSVGYSYLYLFDPQLQANRNPYDPQFRGACDLYNLALERVLRMMRAQGGLQPGTTHACDVGSHVIDITIVSHAKKWQAEDFHRFEFVSDHPESDLPNRYISYGLGVPLIAVRPGQAASRPEESYFPPGLTTPLTAFLRLVPQDQRMPGTAVRHRAVLELYDPLDTTHVNVAGAPIPLESDLSTPLAYFLDNAGSNDFELATQGVLRPDESAKHTGIYMLEPFDPNKIPVLMVHGLWSSPWTWMEMYNDLRADPNLRNNYQFWFYLYPSGQPFLLTAAELRRDLAELRQRGDPARRAPALDQMILVGHSMGGLVSKLQTVSSGDAFWNSVAKQPFATVQSDPETRRMLGEMFYFEPNPSIRRVVTIATPHHGSDLSNSTTRWLGQKFITLPRGLIDQHARLVRENPGIWQNQEDDFLAPTSIDELSPTSPILLATRATTRPPWVTYHNIIGKMQTNRLVGRVTGDGDGVVSMASARGTDVVSEIQVESSHMIVHRHPASILEVRRVLLEHLAQIQANFNAATARRPNAASPSRGYR